MADQTNTSFSREITSGFYNSKNGDRKYNADSISELFEGLINDGIYNSASTGSNLKGSMLVTPGDDQTAETLNVKVDAGRAFLDKKWIRIEAPIRIDFSPSDLTGLSINQARTDAIYIQVDAVSTRRTYICKTNGTPFSTRNDSGSYVNPIGLNPPVIVDENNTFNHVIAYVTIEYGCQEITSSMITSRIGIEPAEDEPSNSATPFVNTLVERANVESINRQLRDNWNRVLETRTNQFNDLVSDLKEEIDRAGSSSDRQRKNYQLLNVDILDADWVEQTETIDYEDYPFVYDILDTNVGDNDTPIVCFAVPEIASGIMAPFAIASTGKLRLYASDRPVHDEGKDQQITIPNIIFIRQATDESTRGIEVPESEEVIE